MCYLLNRHYIQRTEAGHHTSTYLQMTAVFLYLNLDFKTCRYKYNIFWKNVELNRCIYLQLTLIVFGVWLIVWLQSVRKIAKKRRIKIFALFSCLKPKISAKNVYWVYAVICKITQLLYLNLIWVLARTTDFSLKEKLLPWLWTGLIVWHV